MAPIKLLGTKLLLLLVLSASASACRVERFERKSAEHTEIPLKPQPTQSAPAPAPLPIVPPPSGERTEDEKNTITVFRSAAPSSVFVSQQQLVVDYAAGQAMEVPAGKR